MATKIVNGKTIELTTEEIEAINIDRETQKSKADKIAWRTSRIKAYAELGNQFEMIYDLGIDGWKAKITAIKDLYPKPTSGVIL